MARPSTAAPTAEQEPERERSAEQARNLMAAIENGTRQGPRAMPGEPPTEHFNTSTTTFRYCSATPETASPARTPC
ncbi:hypothetical protein [Nocardia vinacea]|uniref:hypothetical protein n=1 Tax=Nocardia vinacea TaxID=96468 RepID=UPI0002FD4846|nr:hypothetical protein [Nocardia vinacea]